MVSGSNELEYGNTPSKFVNKLPIPLELSDNMEMGICELSYLSCQNNIDQIIGALTVFDHLYEFNFSGSSECLYGRMFNFDLAKGYYANENELCDCLNRMIHKMIPRLKNIEIIYYDKNIRRFVIDAADNYLTVSIHNGLQKIMGGDGSFVVMGMEKMPDGFMYEGEKRKYISSMSLIFKPEKDGALKHASRLQTNDTMFVYCDLVKQQYTGNSFSNLLRMCPVRGKDSERQIERFEKVHYVPLSKTFVSTIEIHIKTIEDKFIDLKGLTYVKLHFRKKKH